MIKKEVVDDILKSRIEFINDMYAEFISTESSFRTHPMDFKNFLVHKLEKALEV